MALATIAAGMMAGETLTGAAADQIDARWLAVGLAAMGALLCVFAWSDTAGLALAVLAMFGAANGVAEVVMMTAIHQHVESSYQGRVFGVASTIWRTAMLGALAFAPIVDGLASPPQTITLAAVLLVAGGLVYLVLRPRFQPAPVTA